MKLIIEIPDEDYRFIKKLRYWVGGRCGYKTIQCNVINAIKNGTPYEPKGEWVACTKSGMPLTEFGRMTGEKWYGFKCSQCKFVYKGNALIESPFCQKCGADMRGEENEKT